MKVFKSGDFKNGWFIGDFEPSVIKTKDFEISYRDYKKGEFADAHYHKIAEEVNYLVYGKIAVNDQVFEAPVIFVVEKNELTKTEFLEDSGIIAVKMPSVIGDKFIVDEGDVV